MFDVGFSELVVVALVALIVLGPKRLPEVARTAGQWVARFRRFVADVKSDFDRELQHADLAELRKLKQELDDTRRLMEETSSKLVQQARIEPEPVATTPVPPPGSVPTTPTSPAPPAVEAAAPPATEASPAPAARRPRRSGRPVKKAAKEQPAKDPHG